MDSVSVRNLEQIQEDDRAARPSRFGALLLASLAGAAIVTAGVVMAGRSGPPADARQGPARGARDSGQERQLARRGARRQRRLLSVDPERCGANYHRSRRGEGRARPSGEAERRTRREACRARRRPPRDRLPVVPLPVGDLLSATPVTSAPKDSLTVLAANAAKVPDDATVASAGLGGRLSAPGRELQGPGGRGSRSWKISGKRGHKAYRQAAYVPERGLWYRVRIGPFRSKIEAHRYREKFERTERVAPYVVDPDKVKQAETQRAARLAAQRKHLGDAD